MKLTKTLGLRSLVRKAPGVRYYNLMLVGKTEVLYHALCQTSILMIFSFSVSFLKNKIIEYYFNISTF